ncbi:MAG TPA: DNA-binding protein [Acidobacteriota bacterium]|nr:DNA-binding protein [Acidobacteriota bacterium]
MKKISIVFVISLGVLFLSQVYSAQGHMNCNRNPGCCGNGGQNNTMYDPNTAETLNGEVVSIDEMKPMQGMNCAGVHLTLKTDKETISVHLGPSWFINNQDTKIEVKESIEVKGSRIQFQDQPAIIAAEVTKGDQTLKLRDEKGVPVWSGWKRKANQ